MAEPEIMPLTKVQFYWRAVPTFLLMVVWTSILAMFSGMSVGFSDPGHGYIVTVGLIHMFCIDLFSLSVLGMLLSLKWAIQVQWWLTIAGGVLWLASGAQEPLIMSTVLLILVPLLGTWLHGLKVEMETQILG